MKMNEIVCVFCGHVVWSGLVTNDWFPILRETGSKKLTDLKLWARQNTTTTKNGRVFLARPRVAASIQDGLYTHETK